LCPTDGWISETDFHLDGDLVLPLKRFLESSWTTPWSQTSKAQISPNNGPDYNNNALLSSAPWSAGMLSTQAFDSWNFFKQQKTKRSKARVLYYSNSTASFQILLRSGDISLTPVQRSAAQENKVPEVNKRLLGRHTGPDTVIFY